MLLLLLVLLMLLFLLLVLLFFMEADDGGGTESPEGCSATATTDISAEQFSVGFLIRRRELGSCLVVD